MDKNRLLCAHIQDHLIIIPVIIPDYSYSITWGCLWLKFHTKHKRLPNFLEPFPPSVRGASALAYRACSNYGSAEGMISVMILQPRWFQLFLLFFKFLFCNKGSLYFPSPCSSSHLDVHFHSNDKIIHFTTNWKLYTVTVHFDQEFHNELLYLIVYSLHATYIQCTIFSMLHTH